MDEARRSSREFALNALRPVPVEAHDARPTGVAEEAAGKKRTSRSVLVVDDAADGTPHARMVNRNLGAWP